MQALHEALMRQEELLAYIDRQQEEKFRVSQDNRLTISIIFSVESSLVTTMILMRYLFGVSTEEEVMLVMRGEIYHICLPIRFVSFRFLRCILMQVV